MRWALTASCWEDSEWGNWWPRLGAPSWFPGWPEGMGGLDPTAFLTSTLGSQRAENTSTWCGEGIPTEGSASPIHYLCWVAEGRERLKTEAGRSTPKRLVLGPA